MEDAVNMIIKDGYTPLGGVCVTRIGRGILYTQAVIKGEYEDSIRKMV